MKVRTKILCVDDERQSLIALRALLHADYEVITAQDSEGALELIRQQNIAVVIADEDMPDTKGHELLRSIKSLSPSTVRLLLTKDSDIRAVMHVLDDGDVFRFVPKPWDNTELREMVAKAVGVALNGSRNNRSEDNASQFESMGILIIDDDTNTYTVVKKIYQRERAVHAAHSFGKALEVLDRYEIAVIITEVTVDGQESTDFVKLLKQQYPFIMTIILTNVDNSEAAIELINQGQIFRYLRKSVSESILRVNIRHGLRFYSSHKTKSQFSPALPVNEEKNLPKQSVFQQLRSIGSRLNSSF